MSKCYVGFFCVVAFAVIAAVAIVTSRIKSPHAHFVGEFPPSIAEEVEDVVGVAAADYGLHPLASWTDDPEWDAWHTFSLFLVERGRTSGPTPTVAHGMGCRLSLMFLDNEGLTTAQLDALAEAVVGGIEDQLHLNLCRYDAIRGICMRPAQTRLRYEMVLDEDGAEEPRQAIYDLAERHGVRVASVSDWRREKAAGKEGIFEVRLYPDRRSLHRGDFPILLTNAPAGGRLGLSVFEHGGMPSDDLDALVRDLKGTLERRYGRRFCRAHPHTGVCDTEQRELETLHEKWLEARAAGTAAIESFLAAHPASPQAGAARRRLARLRAMAVSPPPVPPPPAKRWVGRRAGETFADALDDGSPGPAMTVVPAGAFRSGCVSGADCRLDELPVHPVRIGRPFALSTREVTQAEFFRFARPRKRIEPWWAERPATHLTWEEAASYARWLAERTGAAYRLPSEAEWEWAARTGTDTAFPWGREADGRHALCAGCGLGWPPAPWVAPTGSYPPNPWGLFDMHGNAAEWTADCWNPDHLGAPPDGSARTDGDCSRRVARGGSYDTPPRMIRSAARAARQADERYLDVGFRVLRELRNVDAWAE